MTFQVAQVNPFMAQVTRALRMTECLVGSDQIGFRHSTHFFRWFQIMAKSEFFGSGFFECVIECSI